jgi:hypothetical protein
MDITPFIEKELVSKRFILAMAIIVAWAAGAPIPSEVVGLVVGFYFGSHQTVTES